MPFESKELAILATGDGYTQQSCLSVASTLLAQVHACLSRAVDNLLADLALHRTHGAHRPYGATSAANLVAVHLFFAAVDADACHAHVICISLDEDHFFKE